jgi:hypothetical protein
MRGPGFIAAFAGAVLRVWIALAVTAILLGAALYFFGYVENANILLVVLPAGVLRLVPSCAITVHLLKKTSDET